MDGYLYDEKYAGMTERELWLEAGQDSSCMNEEDFLKKWGKFCRDYCKKHGI